MWLAVFADMGATLFVVANGLRLIRARTHPAWPPLAPWQPVKLNGRCFAMADQAIRIRPMLRSSREVPGSAFRAGDDRTSRERRDSPKDEWLTKQSYAVLGRKMQGVPRGGGSQGRFRGHLADSDARDLRRSRDAGARVYGEDLHMLDAVSEAQGGHRRRVRHRGSRRGSEQWQAADGDQGREILEIVQAGVGAARCPRSFMALAVSISPRAWPTSSRLPGGHRGHSDPHLGRSPRALFPNGEDRSRVADVMEVSKCCPASTTREPVGVTTSRSTR